MARPKIVKTKEEAEAIPEDQPLQVQFSEEDLQDPERELSEEKETDVAVKDPERDPEPEKQPEADSLAKRLEAALSAEKAAKEAMAQIQAREDEQRRLAQKYQTDHAAEAAKALQYQLDSVENALAAQQAEIESAKRDLESAKLNGDTKLEIDAIDKITEARAAVLYLQQGKAALEGQKEAIKNTPRELSQGEQFERAISQLPDNAKGWLRKRPEYVTTPKLNRRLAYLYDKLLDDGHVPFSTPFFDALESELGLRQKEAAVPDKKDKETDEAAIVAAPVSREAPSFSSGKPVSNTRVTLSAAEREAARLSGVSEIDYARNKLKLIAMKKEGHYQ